ncbi:MAG: molybdenum cofactor biosynthesis protein [Chloroflexi bacterium RBG_16_48_8]|nr:MAG: molybdenum cofactor biosynthesis protein [Chloroflexi bacterium RBG_16_48_8]
MKVMVLTVSDRSFRGEREDKSGPLLVGILQASGWEVVSIQIVPDDQPDIEDVLRKWADSSEVDVILTTGGTGFSPRDCTPEATRNVVNRIAPGIAEAMRLASLKITPHAMLSRAVAGIRGKTLIVNLPGSPKAAKENLEVILPALPHAVQLLSGDPDAEAGHYPQTLKKHI